MTYLLTSFGLVGSISLASGDAQLKRILFLFWSAFLLIFIGLRRWTGCDFSGYLYLWNLILHMDLNGAINLVEPGFGLLVSFVQYLGMEYVGLNLLAATLFLFGLVLFCQRQPNPLATLALSFPILIIHMAMSGIRQAIAIAFLLLAMNAFNDRKRVLYALLIGIAGSFHYSALVFLPLVVAVGRKPSLWAVVIGCALGAAAVATVAPAPIEVYQARYVASGAPEAAGGAIRAFMVSSAGLMFFLVLRRPWKVSFPADYDLYRMLALATVPLVPLSVLSSVAGDRLSYYLMPAQLAIFARVPYLIHQGGKQQVLAAAPYVILFGFLIVWISMSPLASVCYLPYDNYLFADEAMRNL